VWYEMYQRVLTDRKVHTVHSQSSHLFSLFYEGVGSEGSGHGVIAGISSGCSMGNVAERIGVQNCVKPFCTWSWVVRV